MDIKPGGGNPLARHVLHMQLEASRRKIRIDEVAGEETDKETVGESRRQGGASHLLSLPLTWAAWFGDAAPAPAPLLYPTVMWLKDAIQTFR